MPFSIGPIHVDSIAVLAPMAGITDLVFRRLCKQQRCGLVYTELVNAGCLLQGGRRSYQLVETTPDEAPVGVQLYHHDPATLAEAARWVEEHIPCALIDLNMGCPVPKVVTRGAGAALMRDPHLVESLVRAVVDAVDLPVTAKTRSGWTDKEINAIEVARAVEQAGGQCIAVHARTREQRHEGPVDWDLLAQLRNAVSIPVIGNGGITDAESALAMRNKTGVHAVMIGRGAIGNPWILREVDAAWNDRRVDPPTVDERLLMVRSHLEAAILGFTAWSKKAHEVAGAENRAMRYVRGHLVRYVAGAPGEAGFRKELNGLDTLEMTFDAVRRAWLVDRDSVEAGPTRPGPSRAA